MLTQGLNNYVAYSEEELSKKNRINDAIRTEGGAAATGAAAQEETKSTFFRKYRTLLTHNRYKALFKGWINNTMPHDVTLALLSSYDKMQRNELSEQDAATAYSQHIVDGYIKPTLNQ